MKRPTPDEVAQLSRFANAPKLHKELVRLHAVDATAFDVIARFFAKIKTRAKKPKLRNPFVEASLTSLNIVQPKK